MRDPAEWAGHCLELMDGDGEWLASFPPTVGFREGLGLVSTLTYDRPPGGGEASYFALGDGGPAGIPTLSASGTWRYASMDQAIEHPAELERGFRVARYLHWRGRYLATLRTGDPGSLLCAPGTVFQETTFTGTFHLTTRLTRSALAEAQL